MASNSNEMQLQCYSSMAMSHIEKENAAVHSNANGETLFNITDLPPENFEAILRYLSFENISKIRLVSQHFNNVCTNILNSEFNHLRVAVQQKFSSIKNQMPRRESARRKHPLAQECDIMETLYMRMTLLNMTFGKHIEKKECCFFAGEVLDEIHKVLKCVSHSSTLSWAYKVTDELFDLSTMAMEYWQEKFEPGLPDTAFFTCDVNYSCITSSFFPLAQSHISYLEEMTERLELLPCKISNSAALLIKQVKTLKEIAKRQSKELSRVKTSVKSLNQKITSLEECLHQLKWQQNNSKGKILPGSQKMNEVLFELNLYKHEINLLSSRLPKSIKVDMHSENDGSKHKFMLNESGSLQDSHNPSIDSSEKKNITTTPLGKRSVDKCVGNFKKKQKKLNLGNE